MEIIFYAIYAQTAWLLLMKVFNYTANKDDFVKAVWFLVGFAVLDGYLLHFFKLDSFFLWHIFLFLIFFVFDYRERKKFLLFPHLYNDEFEFNKELNLERALKYYVISVGIYLLCFSMSFLYVYNYIN
jgi:uncharacterized membrane protein